MLLLPLLLSILLEAITSAVSQGKEIKVTRIQEIKHSLLADGMIVFIDNPK